MEVREVDHIHTPELFFVEDEQGNPTLINKEQVYADGVSFRRKAEKGYQDIHFYDDVTKVFHEVDGISTCVAESKVYVERFKNGVWENYSFGKTEPSKELDGKTLGAAKKTKFTEFKITCDWTGGEKQSGKQTFKAVVPALLIRIRWEITIHDPSNLKIGYEDYRGNVSDDHGEVIRTIIFEPDGVVGQIVVDPYLSINEQTTYVDVTCDGYVVRLAKRQFAMSNSIMTISTNAISRISVQSFLLADGAVWYGASDPNLKGWLTESTSERVCFTQSHKFYDDSGTGNPLNGIDQNVLQYVIYPDRVFIRSKIITNKTVPITNSSSYKNLVFIVTTMTSFNYYYRNVDGDETLDNGTERSSAQYLAINGDQLNIQVEKLDEVKTGTCSWYQRQRDNEMIMFGWNNGTLGTDFETENHYFTLAVIIDSADRDQGGS